MVSQRDIIRAKIFDSKNRKAVLFTLWGVNIELRQPNLGAILQAQDKIGEDRQTAIADILIQYCYVPDTSEKIFDVADKEAILNLPVGPDLRNLNEAISELLGLSTKEAEKNSDEMSGDTMPT